MKLLCVLALLSVRSLDAGRAAKQKEIGQAAALSRQEWAKWTTFVRMNHGARLYALLSMTFFFALRCGEACRLKVEDFRLKKHPPELVVPKGKSPGRIPIMPPALKFISNIQSQGS